jgi:hypothetical protein
MAIEFPNTGSFSFTDLTFPEYNPGGSPSIQWGQVRLRFRILNLPAGVTVLVSNIILSGDGITDTLSLPNVTLNSTSIFSTPFINTDTIANPIQWANSRLSFDIQINGGSLVPGSALTYILTYQSLDENNIASEAGNIDLIAIATTVPQATFGLPADVVALITSRFGTVANFLRLRNLGQI